jgi:hypothetical protein
MFTSFVHFLCMKALPFLFNKLLFIKKKGGIQRARGKGKREKETQKN